MMIGSLVKRSNPWKEWLKHNSWMTSTGLDEVGIVVEPDAEPGIFVIWWPSMGALSWEDKEDLEVVSENR